MFIETAHGKFEKVTLIENYVAARCVSCNLLYLLRRYPPALYDRAEERRYLAAQLPKYCPCKFVATSDIKAPKRDAIDDNRRLRRGEGLVIIDLSDTADDTAEEDPAAKELME